MVALPEPLVADVIVTQETLLVACQEQLPTIPRLTLPEPPLVGYEALVGLSKKASHGGTVIEKVCCPGSVLKSISEGSPSNEKRASQKLLVPSQTGPNA